MATRLMEVLDMAARPIRRDTRRVVNAPGPLRCKGSGFVDGRLSSTSSWRRRQHGLASVRSNSRADGGLRRLLISRRKSSGGSDRGIDGAESAWRTRLGGSAFSPRRCDDDGAAEEATRRRCPTLSSPAGKRRAGFNLTMLKSY